MEFERWTEKYSVGDPLMDAYHHVFFQTIEDLAREVEAFAPEAVSDRIAFLADYANMHFQSEERLMESRGYPDLAAHREHHEAFRSELADLRERYRAQPTGAVALELLAMAQDWLIQHILQEDMRYKPYLRP